MSESRNYLIENSPWTRSRNELRRALSDVAPSLAELYEGAVLMLYQNRMPGWTRFVAHAVREIRNRIRGEVEGQTATKRVEYVNLVDDIVSHWEKAGFHIAEERIDGSSFGESARQDSQNPEVPSELFKAISRLVRDHSQSRVARSEQDRRLFIACGFEADKNIEMIMPAIHQWREVTEWFVEHTHDSGRTDDVIDEQLLVQKFEVFEKSLLTLLGEFFGVASEELDEILKEANTQPWRQPTNEQVQRAVALLSRRANYQHFFYVMENPLWIDALRPKGYFKKPPAVDVDTPGTVTFPRWPESRYLARMAVHEPGLVAEVLTGITYTDNIEVQEDVAQAVLNMPAHLSAKFVESFKRLMKSPYFGVPTLPLKFGALISHLAKGGELEAALELARNLLKVITRARGRTEPDSAVALSLLPEPEGRFGSWEYEQILKKHVPDLVQAAGIKGVTVLCDLLEEAVIIKRGKRKELGVIDFSYIWRPAVEDHHQNSHHPFLDALIDAVRDSIVKVAKDAPDILPDMVAMLESRPYSMFKRLSFHLLSLFPDSAPSLMAEHIMNDELFDNHHVLHEYFQLCSKGFQHLSSEQAEKFLQRIENGPDRSAIKRWIESDGRVATDEQIDRIIRHWRRDRLASVKDHLSGDWSQECAKLISEFGEPEHPDFPFWHESGSGPNSPLSPGKLATMATDEIITLMRTWNPPSELVIEPSREGLGRAFSRLVESEPTRFSASAGKFIGVDPTYVRTLLSGLDKAMRAGTAIDWSEVMNLCQWVVVQPRTVQPHDWIYEDRDPDWGWTRGEMADLLEAGLSSGPSRIPFSMRHQVWKVLEPLTSDPDPINDEQDPREKRDPLMDSWNTTRGKAMRAVIYYAVWIKENIQAHDQEKPSSDYGFEVMPEVRKVLEEHLDIEKDSSLAIRSVYGQWIPWLAWLDRIWTEKNLPLIFPRESSQAEYWQVAWESYVKSCKAQLSIFVLLREEYERAIGTVGETERDHSSGDNQDDALAAHLMTIYWHGLEDIDDDRSLVRQFFEKAPSITRAHALYLIGLTLNECPGDLDPDLSSRLRKLWEWRLKNYGTDITDDPERCELSAFGWWFTSGKLDRHWALTEIQGAIRVCGRLENAHEVVETLKQIAGQFPTEVAECLLLLVQRTKETWQLHYWREDAYAALETVCQVGNSEAIKVARKTANLFGERGFRNFKGICASPWPTC